MTTTTETINVDQFISRPPKRVWEALVDPEQLAKWWAAGDIAPIVGHKFFLQMPGWGNTPCEIVDVDEPERLVYTFADWTLTWRLVAEGSGTRLFLDHSGFDLDNPQHTFGYENMGPGWRNEILPALAALVESS